MIKCPFSMSYIAAKPDGADLYFTFMVLSLTIPPHMKIWVGDIWHEVGLATGRIGNEYFSRKSLKRSNFITISLN